MYDGQSSLCTLFLILILSPRLEKDGDDDDDDGDGEEDEENSAVYWTRPTTLVISHPSTALLIACSLTRSLFRSHHLPSLLAQT